MEMLFSLVPHGETPNPSVFFPPQIRIRFESSEEPPRSRWEQVSICVISVRCKLDMQVVSLPSKSPKTAKQVHKYLLYL